MVTYLTYIWDKLRGSYWFLPAFFSSLAILLGVLVPEYEPELLVFFPDELPQWLETTTDASRTTLSVITGTMFTVAGTVFSISVVTLSLTSQQFGPRLLRSFMSDLTTQFTLGLLIATAIYSLLVLRIVANPSSMESYEPPHLSLLLALVLTVVSAGTLIFFIHRITILIQAPNVIETLARELDESLERLIPAEDSSSKEGEDDFFLQGKTTALIASKKEGYIQAIDIESLVALGKKNDAQIELLRRPGHFIECEDKVARIYTDSKLEDEKQSRVSEKLNSCLLVGNRRTPRQDLECAVDELVEIAIRALSPGVNDTFSALSCIDRLGAFLKRFVGRAIPSRAHRDSEGVPYVLSVVTSHSDVIAAALNKIRQSGRTNVAVGVRLLEILRSIAENAIEDETLDAIEAQALVVLKELERSGLSELDAQDVQRAFLSVKEMSQEQRLHQTTS